MWGGIPSVEGMSQKSLPNWIKDVTKRLLDSRIVDKPLNHILLNEYNNGKGIGVSDGYT